MKAWDKGTSRRAMGTKIRDSRRFIKHNSNALSQLKKQYLLTVDNRGFKLRKMMNEMNKMNRKAGEKKKLSNEKKLKHLKRVQQPLMEKANKYIFTPTKTPDRLKEYSPLPVFGGPMSSPNIN